VLFIVPLLFNLRLNKKGIVILICAYLFGFILQAYLGDYLQILDMEDADSRIYDKAMAYAESDKYMSGSGYLRATVNLFILLTAIWYLKRYNKYNNRNVLKLEPIVMAGLVFTVLMVNVFIAYRFTDYFKIPYAILYSELFVSLIKSNKRKKGSLSGVVAIIIFLPLFYVLGRTIINNNIRYYPYSSVIELSVDRERELHYNMCGRPTADYNVY
jgi:magnesium-transporting ATPase (P-type)